jgi:biopolymer transport protein ExbB
MIHPPLGSIVQFFVQGGSFMILLLGCSVIGVAVVILRILALRKDIVIPERLRTEVAGLPAEEGEAVEKLTKVLMKDQSPAGRILRVAVKHANHSRSEAVEAVQTVARGEVVRLEKGLFVLEIIVGIAPLLGLLGAVSGLVQVFGAFGKSEEGADPHIIAAGISEALSTTIVGLAIAIPCLIAHSFFTRTVETLASDMEGLVGQFIARIYQNRPRRLSARISGPDAASARRDND